MIFLDISQKSKDVLVIFIIKIIVQIFKNETTKYDSLKLDDEIIQHALDEFGISKEEAEKQVQELIDSGFLVKNYNPSMPSEFTLSTVGSKYAEKTIKEDYGEFKKITDHNGISYKVPTIVIIREGVKEEDLHHFPLWTDE